MADALRNEKTPQKIEHDLQTLQEKHSRSVQDWLNTRLESVSCSAPASEDSQPARYYSR